MTTELDNERRVIDALRQVALVCIAAATLLAGVAVAVDAPVATVVAVVGPVLTIATGAIGGLVARRTRGAAPLDTPPPGPEAAAPPPWPPRFITDHDHIEGGH